MSAGDPAGALPVNARVLIADGDEAFVHEIAADLESHQYRVEIVPTGRQALSAIASDPPDVALLDIGLPDTSGFDICRRVKQEWRTRLVPVVLMREMAAPELRIAAFDAGADDCIAKDVDRHELRARLRALVRMKRYTDDLDSAAAILMSLAVLIEGRDGHGEGHCHRMANYATALGRRLALDDEDVQALHRGGFLHDIGMLAIPESVLNKAEGLAPDEYELVKSHTTIGESLCVSLRSLGRVRPIIRSHHERLDGSGYPDGLRGDAVPLLAQIMGLVDAFEGLTTRRSYRQAQSVDHALDILWGQVARGWRRRDLVEAFADIVESRGLDGFGAARA